MSLIVKPSDLPRWATDLGATVIEPPNGKKNTGWIFEEAPPFQFMNWLQNLFGAWTQYFNDTGVLQTFDDAVVLNQEQVINFDAEFITGNLIDLDLNTVAITQVPFNIDHLTTIGDLATEIQSNADVLTAIVNPDNDREVIITANNKALLIENIIVTGGASQAVSVLRESVAIIKGTVTSAIGQFAGRGAGIFQDPKFIFISTQIQFEKYFGKSFEDKTAAWFVETLSGQTYGGVRIPEGTMVFLSPIIGTLDDSVGAGGDGIGDDGTNVYNGKSAYVLKNAVALSDNVSIIGAGIDSVFIIRDETDAANRKKFKFHSFSDNQQVTTLAPTASGTFNGVPDTSGINIGDVIHWNKDREVYTIISKTGSTLVTNRTILDVSGTSVISLMIRNVIMEGFTFDGRGNVDNLGGGAVAIADEFGSGFEIPFSYNFKINCRIINHSVTLSGVGGGGAIWGGGFTGNTLPLIKAAELSASAKITAHNIEFCNVVSATAGSGGGGVMGCDYSDLKIKNCFAEVNGGGASSCNHSLLLVDNCIVNNFGAGVYDSDFIRITANNCTAVFGGGAHTCNESEITANNCTGTSNGGGAVDCNNSKITANSCTATSGGGAFTCNNSRIIANNCTATVGGGVHTSNKSEITAINCTANVGGGAFSCDNSKIIANDCTATNGGGASECDGSIIVCIVCTATNDGGGAFNSFDITLTARGCVASGDGGGAAGCDNLNATGNWDSNTAVGDGNHISASGGAKFFGLFIHDGAPQFEEALQSISVD